MATTHETDAALGRTGGPAGNVPGTEHSGAIYLEVVTIERMVDGMWEAAATAVPATFEMVGTHARADLAAWTHRPLARVWLPGGSDVRDGDRLVRADGLAWTVRGLPAAAPARTHVVVLAQAATDDTLFGT